MKNILYIIIILGISLSLHAQIGPATLFKENSALSEGKIYKIEIKSTGIHKIDYKYLKDAGIDVAALNPANIHILGKKGGRLKEIIDENYDDDLTEIPVYLEGDGDGKFDSGDYILFYAENADKWQFNADAGRWDFDKNIYSFDNYYFIKIDDTPGKRIQTKNITATIDSFSNEYDNYAVHEEDRINLLGFFNKTEGSGQQWYGESVAGGRTVDFSSYFDDFDFIPGKGIDIQVIFAGRDKNSKNLRVTVNDVALDTLIRSVNFSNPDESIFARRTIIDKHIFPEGQKLDIKLQYDGESGWLDKIQINARANLRTGNKQIIFSDKNKPAGGYAGFEITGNINPSTTVWSINSLGDISEFTLDIKGDKATFVYDATTDDRFILFNKQGDFYTPGKVTEIENQNLHGIDNVEMLVVYHKDFEEAALKYVEYRKTHDNMNLIAVESQKIFNEFSSGKFDPTAIRDFVRMLKARNSGFKYLMLIGDGSYDARGIETDKDNFIPVYETKSSLDPVDSYPSDDYFGLLDTGEGDNLKGFLDIGTGRLPVRTAAQANNYIDKVISYETDIEYYGDWQNNITFSADDYDKGDGLHHFYGAESLAKLTEQLYPIFNINKIYLDAYIQVNNAGGQRYPEVNKAITESFFKGQLIFVYFGHGGPKGLAQERVLQKVDIENWNNKTKLPLMITATCSFAGFDDPNVNTAGEVAFLKEKGGLIGLVSTVRAVYSSGNERLLKKLFNTLLQDENTHHLPLGELIKRAKVNSGSNKNNKRKFHLFGDPALRLKIPSNKVFTTKINGKTASGEGDPIDTLRALDEITIEGYTGTNNGEILQNFNGDIYITLFDKKKQLQLLANDHDGNPSLRKKFYLQKNILFKGQAKVVNGKFSMKFLLPKDIDYKFGKGKLSYYALDTNLVQAAGTFENFIIGGTSPTGIADKQGPDIELYMNDENFAYGGITDSNPVLIGKLYDESGINITGLSIGHDLSALVNNTDKYILNDFYKSETGNYKKGTFKFPLSKLKPGKYTIKVEAWDILNNKSEKSIEFTVVDKNDDKLHHVLNYPNPFSTKTTFSFEHNLPDTGFDIVINIFSMSGKIVKSIRRHIYSQGYRINDIQWDGTDDYGERLANGIYVYKIKIYSDEYNIYKESKFEKLVILK